MARTVSDDNEYNYSDEKIVQDTIKIRGHLKEIGLYERFVFAFKLYGGSGHALLLWKSSYKLNRWKKLELCQELHEVFPDYIFEIKYGNSKTGKLV